MWIYRWYNGEVSECYIWHILPKYQCGQGKWSTSSFLPTQRGSCVVGVLKLHIVCHTWGSVKCITCMRERFIDVDCIMLLNSLICLQTPLTMREICNKLICQIHLTIFFVFIHTHAFIEECRVWSALRQEPVNLHWELPAECLLLGKPFCLSVHAWILLKEIVHSKIVFCYKGQWHDTLDKKKKKATFQGQ